MSYNSLAQKIYETNNTNVNLLCKKVNAGGQTSAPISYGITLTCAENRDTYFYLFTYAYLQDGVTYTLSCYASGIIGSTYFSFPLFSQSNPLNVQLLINKNGLNYVTFTYNLSKTSSYISSLTYENYTIYPIMMDDLSRNISSGQGAVQLSHFKLEIGSTPTNWVPSLGDSLHISSDQPEGPSTWYNIGTRV